MRWGPAHETQIQFVTVSLLLEASQDCHLCPRTLFGLLTIKTVLASFETPILENIINR